ncbi:MAG: family 20 glycosylhydrolase [Ignavibacteriaceae bacterium]|jgi:hexosaminidase
MKSYYKILTGLLFVFFLSLNIYSQNIHELNLMPYPKEISLQTGKFRINRDFAVKVTGDPGIKVYHAATRFLRRLDKKTGTFFKEGYVTPDSTPNKCNVVIEVNRPGKVKLGEDESYKLTVTENNILINAPTDLGAIHSLQTLLQLVSSDSNGYYFPDVEINDSPRFPWRGLMIDVARHFMPVNVIKRNIDGMVAVKLNVLHLHLSDDQGFRVECKTFPKLQEMGSDGKYFTHAQIKDIIKYANDRGIRVYPEFDMPGHTTSWFVGYPQYASLPPGTDGAPAHYSIERKWGVFNPTFNPTINKTYEFLDKFFKEMSALFPDEYIHVGGDENNGVQWNASKEIRKFKKDKGFKDNEELQGYFISRVQKILEKYGKKMIGWDEILQKDMPKDDVIIQSWRGTAALKKSAMMGYRGILSNGYYIDLMQPASYHYLNDPRPDSLHLTPEEKSKILGGEATMWAEWVTKENIDSRIWPRTAAIAERFWSPKNVNNVQDMYKRLDHVTVLIEEYGLRHITFQPKILRVLTNGQPIEALKVFVNVVKPLEGYERNNFKKYGGHQYFQYSPHTLVVDAALADPKPARDLNNLIDKYLNSKNPQCREVLKKCLMSLKENHKKLLPVINNSPILKEIEPLSQNLSDLAATGLDALNYIENKNKVSGDWIKHADSVLNKSLNPYGKVHIAVVSGIKKLVQAVIQNTN